MCNRVLHVVNKMGYGGIETFLMNIYRNMDREKIQFDFAVHTDEPGDYDEEIKKLGGNIYYFTSRRKNVIKYKSDWKKFLSIHKDNYVAIHMHVSSLTTILPLKIAKKYGIKKVFIHAHSTFQKGKLHNFLNKINQKKINKIATNCLACSIEAGKYVFGNNNFEIIHNAIDVNKFVFVPKIRNELRAKLGVEDKFVILHVGRFNYEKNHTFLIDIFYEVKLVKKDSVLYLIGKGELKDKIREKVKEKKLEDSVVFLENITNVNEYMMASDLFLFPSLFEGLGIVNIEAQCTGLKCIISDKIPSEVKITDLIKFLSIKDTPQKWKDEVLNTKFDSRKSYDENIKKEKYDIKSVVNILNELYL